jgi:hypothetical protein
MFGRACGTTLEPVKREDPAKRLWAGVDRLGQSWPRLSGNAKHMPGKETVLVAWLVGPPLESRGGIPYVPRRDSSATLHVWLGDLDSNQG